MSAAASPPLPWWRLDKRPVAWVPLGAVALFVIIGGSTSTSDLCSAASPCGPDWLGSLLLGLLLGSAGAVFLHRWTAFLLAVALSVLWEFIAWQSSGEAWWLQLAVLGYAALCFRVADLPAAPQAPPALTLPVPAPGGSRHRLGRGWRLVAAALVLGGTGVTWGTVAQQHRVESQEGAAQVVTGQVTGHASDTAITVHLDDVDARVEVLDADAYPVGSSLDFLTDDRGLRQPVSEPYDVTGLLALAGLAFGLALAALLRARGYEHGLRRFLGQPQPARLVRVINADGIIAVYPYEPSGELDPPYLIYPALGHRNASLRHASTGPAATGPEAGGQPEADDGAELAPVLATLYGVDAPGHWCAAEVDGVLLTPARPARGGPGPAAEPESLDAPVDPDELLPDDRAVDFRVRTHRRHTLLGVLQALGVGAGTVFVFARFLDLGTTGLTVLSVVVFALATEITWRTVMRPRVLWHGAGLAVLSPFGAFSSRWDDVVQISAGRGDVTVIADGIGGAVVPTRRRPGRLPERTTRQLALALRHARQHSLLGEPPAIPLAHRPGALYLASAAVIPALVIVLNWM